MINKQTFGSFIREKRIEKGLTQKELAEILFLSESAISKWEMGKSYPDITLMPDICRVLDVSEHELISGANDTEYRRIKEEARLYHRITETFFCGFTGAYILAFVICLICDLAVNRRLTFTPVVFAGLLTAFTFIPTCTRFTKEHKLAAFTLSTYGALVILFLVCCIKYKANWFGIAAVGTLLGYVVCFGPLLMKKYFSKALGKFQPAVFFAVCFVIIALLLFTVNMTVLFDIKSGMLILLFALIPFAVTALMHILPCKKDFRISADVFAFGAVLYSMQYCVNKILGIDASADYAVDFTDINCANGNIYLIILCIAIAVSLGFLISGIVKSRKK